MSPIFVLYMKAYCKILGMASAAIVIMLGVVGCGGINASKSVSPASFLIPGLLQADPPVQAPMTGVPNPEPVKS